MIPFAGGGGVKSQIEKFGVHYNGASTTATQPQPTVASAPVTPNVDAFCNNSNGYARTYTRGNSIIWNKPIRCTSWN